MKTANILSGFFQELPLKKTELPKKKKEVQELKNNSETWQLLQEAYRNWQACDKEKLTKKSELLKTLKESCRHERK